MMMNHIVSKAVINCRHTYLKLCLNRINIFHHKNKYYNYFSHNKVETYSSSTPTSSVSSLEKLYKKSLFIINNKQYQPINTVDNDVKLKMYALYKQIEDGPLNASSHSKPGFFDPIGRAKYEAWLSLGLLKLNCTYMNVC
jgi:acyl-CoA-binding protein